MSIPQNVIDALLPLCTQRKVEQDIRDSAQLEYDRIGAEIGALLASNDLIDAEGKAKVDLEWYGVSLNSSVPRSTIDAELLAAQGIPPDVIKAATKTTYSARLEVGLRGELLAADKAAKAARKAGAK